MAAVITVWLVAVISLQQKSQKKQFCSEWNESY